MARIGLLALACAGAFLLPGSPVPVCADPPDEDALSAALAVQAAMQQGRYHLQVRADPKKAVEVLEAQVTRIKGNRDYLLLLRDAYRAYIKDLHLANQTAL